MIDRISLLAVILKRAAQKFPYFGIKALAGVCRAASSG